MNFIQIFVLVKTNTGRYKVANDHDKDMGQQNKIKNDFIEC